MLKGCHLGSVRSPSFNKHWTTGRYKDTPIDQSYAVIRGCLLWPAPPCGSCVWNIQKEYLTDSPPHSMCLSVCYTTNPTTLGHGLFCLGRNSSFCFWLYPISCIYPEMAAMGHLQTHICCVCEKASKQFLSTTCQFLSNTEDQSALNLNDIYFFQIKKSYASQKRTRSWCLLHPVESRAEEQCATMIASQ